MAGQPAFGFLTKPECLELISQRTCRNAERRRLKIERKTDTVEIQLDTCSTIDTLPGTRDSRYRDTVLNRLARFTKPPFKSSSGNGGGEGGTATFDLLGFTHYWRRSFRSRAWVIQRKTASSRLSRAIRRVTEWCRTNRHLDIAEQCKALASKLRGHYQYFGLTGNGRALKIYFNAVRSEWHRWLNRRSQRNTMTWERFENLLRHYSLPRPILVHSVYGAQRSRDSRSRMR